MQSKKHMCNVIIVWTILTACIAGNGLAANLVWQTSKQAAVELATQQNKKILLVAGRDT